MKLELLNMNLVFTESASKESSQCTPPPTPKSLQELVVANTMVVHETKKGLNLKQIAIQLNYLQRLHGLKTGKDGEWNATAQEQLVRWFAVPRRGSSSSISANQLALNNEPANNVDEEPSIRSEPPIKPDEKPTSSTEPPIKSVEKPTSSTEPPTESKDEPTSSTEPPTESKRMSPRLARSPPPSQRTSPPTTTRPTLRIQARMTQPPLRLPALLPLRLPSAHGQPTGMTCACRVTSSTTRRQGI